MEAARVRALTRSELPVIALWMCDDMISGVNSPVVFLAPG